MYASPVPARRRTSRSRSRNTRASTDRHGSRDHRSRTPIPRITRDHVSDCPFEASDKWRPDRQHYDTNLLYGLTLPRTVVDTPHSRALGTANMPIHQVRLHQVVFGGASNWLMRHVAHGKYVAIEMFRSHKEAMVFSKLSKLLKESSVDLEAVATKLAQDRDQETTTKEGKQRAFSLVSQKLFEVLKDMMPGQAPLPQEVLDKIRELEAANAVLRNALNDKQHTNNRSSTPSLPIVRALGITPEKAKERSNQEPIPVSQTSTVPEEPTTSPSVVQQCTCNGRRRVLATEAPAGAKGVSITNWLSKPANAKYKKRAEQLSKDLIAAVNAMPGAEQPSFPDLAAEWGLPVQLATKMDRNQLSRVVAAAAAMVE